MIGREESGLERTARVAELGFFLDRVPLLGTVFRTGAGPAAASGLPASEASVHHGHHHGMDGLLLALSALVLSRAVEGVGRRWARVTLAAYLSLMLVYGLVNFANDFWTEQVLKRGWAHRRLPGMLEPRPTLAWGVILAVAAAIWVISSLDRPQTEARQVSSR